MPLDSYIHAIFGRSIETKRAAQADCIPSMVRIAELLKICFRSGNNLLLCCNDGSAADDQHVAAKLLVRFRPEVNRTPIPFIALAMDFSSTPV